MHIAEVVTIAKSLPLLRLNTYKSLILSYSADYRRIFQKSSTSVYPIEERLDNDLLFIRLYGKKFQNWYGIPFDK